MSTQRTRVLSELTSKVGFPFSESELSPPLRKRIGELQSLLIQLDKLRADVSAQEKKLDSAKGAAFLLGALGFVIVLFTVVSPVALIIGIVILFGAYYYYDQTRKETVEIQAGQQELNKFVSENNPKFDVLAADIFGELSSRHLSKQSVRTDIPVTVQREIERETVKIRCPYCRTINPDSRAVCLHCGARL